MHDDDVGSRSGAKQEALVARIQNETGAGLTASYVNGVGLKRVENSRVIHPRGDLGNASLRNCIIYGNTESVDFSGADLTGFEITLALVFRQNDKTSMMKVADFKNACLDDADLAIDYSYLKDMQRDASTDQLRREGTLSAMNRDVGGTPIGPLPTINSLGDRYDSLKLKLMREALEVCASAGVVGDLSKAWADTLMQSPIYLADPEIQRLAGPLLN